MASSFYKVAFDGSVGNTPCLIYVLMGDIQDGCMLSLITVSPPSGFSMLIILNFSWIKY